MLKAKTPNLADELTNFFEQAVRAFEYAPANVHLIQKEGPGRSDYQEIWTTENLEWLSQKDRWVGLSSAIMVYRRWTEKGKEHEERRYYICSYTIEAERLVHLIKRHWHLDVSLGEDDSKIGP